MSRVGKLPVVIPAGVDVSFNAGLVSVKGTGGTLQMTLNTFHLAGVASKSNVTRGVPRLKELLKVTQNPKAISLTIPLKKEYRNSKAKAREVSQELELTLMSRFPLSFLPLLTA